MFNISIFVVFSFAPMLALEAPSDDRPNIVVILADDLGYGDVQPLNSRSKIPTPNYNRLAKEGMTFTDAHSASAVCTPTRYSLLCGRYPWRSSLKRGVLGGYSQPLIEKDRQTIASLAKQAGFQTGCIGKWHLGLGWQWHDKPSEKINNMGIAGGKPNAVDFGKPLTHGPNTLGFDYSFIIPASLDMSPYVYIRNDRATAIPDEIVEGKKFPAYSRKGEIAVDFKFEDVLDKLTTEACDFIKRSSQSDKPFLLYFPLSAPHKPVLPHSRFRDKTELGTYGDFVHQVDWTVGQVMKTLDDVGAAENTLLLVTSDNGSFMFRHNKQEDHVTDSTIQRFHPDNHRANGSWRGTKADIWEAGHRVPFFARWPKEIKPGSKCNGLVCQTDILATIAQLVGVEFDSKSAPDSFSMFKLLKGDQRTRKPVVHHSINGQLAIRDGDWKLIMGSGSGGREKPRGKPFEQPYQIFDLKNDPQEKTNRIEEQSERMKSLVDQFEEISKGDHSVKP